MAFANQAKMTDFSQSRHRNFIGGPVKIDTGSTGLRGTPSESRAQFRIERHYYKSTLDRTQTFLSPFGIYVHLIFYFAIVQQIDFGQTQV
jgi:hypothetical protein